jgi:glucosamine-6-phosphate deaminase
MNTVICQDALDIGQQAATAAAEHIRRALKDQGYANIIVATGASQFEVLAALVAAPPIIPLGDWSRVVGFHLDEYVGLSMSHPASFRKYLKERFVDRVPLAAFHYISGEGDPQAECRRVGDLIKQCTIDVALVGIGENGHLAFNDPPADFETDEPYLVVELDNACRMQQLGEGWFPSLDDVPQRAISMSIRQIMKSRAIVCSVPDRRKAQAVQASLQGPVTPHVPASILQQHACAEIYLDPASASLLKKEMP